jgi:hypothetical protein
MADELAGRDDFVLLPELGKMPLVAGHQVVGTGGMGALQKLVIAGVLRDWERMRRADKLRMVLHELEELLRESPDVKFGTSENLLVFRKNGFGDVPLGRFRDRQHEVVR